MDGQVLLKMHEEWDSFQDGARRLARFREALEGMGLFEEGKGPLEGSTGCPPGGALKGGTQAVATFRR